MSRRFPFIAFSRRWERFWFVEAAPEVLALLRIALGLVGLTSLLALTPVSAYWSLDGMMPASGGGLGVRDYLASMGLGTTVGWALFLVLLAAFVALVVGLLVEVAVPLAFAGSIIQAFWNPLPLAASHRVMICLLFCLLWSDSGRTLSLVRSDASARWLSSQVWPLRLMQIQIALIYSNSGFAKLMAEPWRDGTAVHYAVRLNFLHRLPIGTPDFWPATAVATYVTLVWELTFAVLLLHRWTRRIALASGICLHVGMFTLLELGTFPWVMLAGYLAFLPPAWATTFTGILKSGGRAFIGLGRSTTSVQPEPPLHKVTLD